MRFDDEVVAAILALEGGTILTWPAPGDWPRYWSVLARRFAPFIRYHRRICRFVCLTRSVAVQRSAGRRSGRGLS